MIFAAMQDGTRLGLGGAPLGNLFRTVAEAEAQALVAHAWRDGCRTFDTAPHYGNGLSEHRMGTALRPVPRDELVLSSKVGRLLEPDATAPAEQNSYVAVLPFRQRWDYSAAGVRRSVEDSLQRLGQARLDVAFIHDCDAVTHGAGHARIRAQVIGETIPALEDLKATGLVRHIGLGVNDVEICLDVLHAARIDCLLLAGRYSLIDHSALAELLPLAHARGTRIALGGVFNSGILATGVRNTSAPIRFNYDRAGQEWIERVAAIEAICAEEAVPLRAAALQFPLAHPAVEILLAGAQTIGEWDDTRAMLRQPIRAGFWRRLQTAGLLPPEAPVPEAAS
ncbi:oxidoreductase [Aliidongia dinghuensis]|uniref:Oxidoreductase n=1 Tax=Aliidongia dinghuensis TaxID=1867774 RepID=A0A8J2Z1F0_9PROT|nr:aldo/keto reductase [Aliidongia dinghuensis]GGF44555.1 oxidoreductase [Aliidongia dinghuensis]